MGMYVSTKKKKDDKTIMEHKSYNNLKWNISRILEFGSEISLRVVIELNKRTTRRCFLMRRVKRNGEHNKKEVQR